MIELCIGLGVAVLILATACWRVTNENNELREASVNKFHDELKAPLLCYELSVKFLKIDNVGDNQTFNRQVEMLEKDGYHYVPDKSNEAVLCFEKRIYDDEKKEK